MTHYNTSNVQLSNSQLNKLKSERRKNDAKITLNISPNVISDSNNENYFPHKLLLTDTQMSKLCTAFENVLSAYQISFL